jgi:hypothetical protein
MSIFPLVKRFQDVKTSPSSALLKEESVIHDKCFRAGTVFLVVGWREVQGKPYLILSKGSWEGLVPHDEYSKKLEKIEDGK